MLLDMLLLDMHLGMHLDMLQLILHIFKVLNFALYNFKNYEINSLIDLLIKYKKILKKLLF